MSKEPIGLVGDPDSKYDRFVVATFAVCFQLAEVMLIVGAFRYAGIKTGSPLLNGIASVLGFVGAMWLGLVLPGTIGRLEFWRKTTSAARYGFAFLMICASMYGAHLYLQAVAVLAKAQT